MLYEEIRYERAHIIQDYSRQAGKDWENGKPKVNSKLPNHPRMDTLAPILTSPVMAFTNYNFGHDEIDHASNIFRRWQWSRQPDSYFKDTATPFGPFRRPPQSSSRQNGARKQQYATATANVRLKTSRTFLETLFPTAELRFAAPGTVATAEFQATRFSGDGDGDKTRLRLYLHGVQYLGRDRPVVSGKYLAVQFKPGGEDSFPASVDCDVSFESTESGRECRVAVNWRGIEFMHLALDGLEEASEPENRSAKEEDILMYEVIPPEVREGGDGDPAGAYECVVSSAREGTKNVLINGTSNGVRRWVAAKDGRGVTVKIGARNREELPTLHHVAGILAEMPVFEVVSAEVVGM